MKTTQGIKISNCIYMSYWYDQFVEVNINTLQIRSPHREMLAKFHLNRYIQRIAREIGLRISRCKTCIVQHLSSREFQEVKYETLNRRPQQILHLLGLLRLQTRSYRCVDSNPCQISPKCQYHVLSGGRTQKKPAIMHSMDNKKAPMK